MKSLPEALLGGGALEEYLAYRPDSDSGEIRQRILDGQWCFVAHLEGRLVALGWVARDVAWIEHVDCSLRLRDDCV
jgi:hypothetical protein